MEKGERVFVWDELTYEQQKALYLIASSNDWKDFKKGDLLIPLMRNEGCHVFYNDNMIAYCVGVVQQVTNAQSSPKCDLWIYDVKFVVTPEQYEEAINNTHEVEITEADAAELMSFLN